MNNIISAALLYASVLKWKIIPVGSPIMKGGGKTPLIKDWQNKATDDPQVISDWWKRWPEANVGVATGKASGILVIDLDLHHDADDSLFDLESQYGKLPFTTESLTGGGGKHLFFQYPPGVIIKNSVSKLGPGIDVRSDGGQVVLPPSVHKSGVAYQWEATSHPSELPPQPLPQMYIDLLAEPDDPTQSSGLPNKVTKGRRNNLLASLAGVNRAKGLDPDEILVLLMAVNDARCDPPLAHEEVIKIAKSIGRYAPRKQSRIPTDDELAADWIIKHPGYCYGMGDFRKYEGGIWSKVDDLIVEKTVIDLMKLNKRNGYKPTSYKMKSITTFIMREIHIPDSRWNANPDLLVCTNGTLEISTQKLREHRMEDYITSRVDYDFDPLAEAPTWDYYLMTVLNTVKGFLQEFAGYSLITSCKYETAVWLYGPAGSGKSTFIEGLLAMLRNKAGILGLADIEQSSFALEDLPDKTLLVSTEQPARFLKSSHKINAIISGEPVKIDRKYKEQITIIPKAKIIWAMNELPRIGGASSGIFRRVKVVRFPPMPPGVADPGIKEQIKSEGAGILAWALRGLARLNGRGGFDIPAEVVKESEDFKKSSDIPAMFIDDECETGPQCWIRASTLYNAYVVWCNQNGHKSQSSTSLAQDWDRLGFKKERRNDGVYYLGVMLRPPPGIPI